MCGRYAATRDPATLAAEFDAVDGTTGQAPEPDHNVAPTKRVLTVVDRGERAIRVMRWGLVPHWAKDRGVGAKMINARAETVTSKPAFRTSLARRRCLVPADGWFEWRREGGSAAPAGRDAPDASDVRGAHSGRKQPYFMTPSDGSCLAMAGIFTTWRPPDAPEDEPPLITCAVLTTTAVGVLGDIHDRMPLLLPSDAWSRWLDPTSDAVGELLTPPTEDLVERLELRPVSTTVNSVRNNGPALVARADPRSGAAGAP